MEDSERERTMKRADEMEAKMAVQHKEDVDRSIVMFFTSTILSSISLIVSAGKADKVV